MAQRDLTVRLRADIGQYRQAMAEGAKSTDSLVRAGTGIQNLGRSVSSVGDNLTKSVTLPILAVGAASLKMAADFGSSFTQMQTLAGVSASEVDGLKESVLDLAGETGKAPQELAEALYFLRSSGLDASGAMEALEVSAKASAAGLGDTVVIADAVSSAMMAYSEAGLTAAEATDVLVATARAGKAEPQELAGELGRLIPLSAELGISFADVGGAVAALSTKGNDAAAASTQLLGVMSKLLRPSQQAAEQLDQVGLSTDSIREMIAEKGLLGTLEELQARLGNNGFIKYLEDVQAVQGGLGLLGGDLNKTRDIFTQVNDSAGATGDAFATWAESMGAKNARAFAQLQVAMIRVGEAIGPIAADVAGAIADIAEAFSNLTDGQQAAILWGAAILAAIGPIMSVGGRVITVVGGIVRAFGAMRAALVIPEGAVAGALGRTSESIATTTTRAGALGTAMRVLPWAAVIGGAIAWAHSMSETKVNVDGWAEALGSTSDAMREQGEEAVRGFIAMGEFDRAVSEVADSNVAAAERMVETAEALGLEGDALQQVKDIVAEKSAADAQAAEDQQANSAAVQEATGAYGEQAAGLEEATSALQAYVDTLKAQTDPLFAAMDAIVGNRDAQVAYQDSLRGVTEAQAALDQAIADHGAGSAEAAEATRNLESAQRAVGDAQWATVESAAAADSALAGLSDAVERGDVDFATFTDTLNQWVAQGFITQEQADVAALSIMGLAGEADNAATKRVSIPVGEVGAARTKGSLNLVQEAAQNVDRQRPVVRAGASDRASPLLAYIDRKRAELDGRTATVTVTTIQRTLIEGARNLFPSLRARGGPVRAGEAYIVGEQRAELFIPDQDGTVLPEVPRMGGRAPAGLMSSAGGGAQHVTNIHIGQVVANDPQALVDGLKRYERVNGPIPVAVRG